ncbi:MAG: SAM-dependent methyltransferase [Ignavibacteriae bacterium]|nr:SAM-dependent methyltransferase [Ignavibacteriota bacterium]
MINNIKKSIKNNLRLYKNNSYSQEGEDLILHKIFPDKKNGFYVDIGAHHPFRFSNTYYFYRKGWRGVNIDAAPGSMKLFNKYRSRDINIEAAISNKIETLTYYKFNDPALNTFDKDLAQTRIGNKYKIISEEKIAAIPLKEILSKQKIGDIDFMSIDVEGLEMKVLESNDWNVYQPKILLVESIASDLVAIYNTELYKFINNMKYTLFAKTFNTLFFKKDV